MQLNPSVQMLGMVAAVIVWGVMVTAVLFPQLKRLSAVVSLSARRMPLRTFLGAAAFGIAIAYGGTKPIPPPAESTAKVVVDGATLRFVYDVADYGAEGTNWFSVAAAEAGAADSPPWRVRAADTVRVVFDESFADYGPAHCVRWFDGFAGLASIEGLGNLDTSGATDMAYMFAGCEALASLDLAGFSTANVTNMTEMFRGCEALASLDLAGFSTANVTNMTGMFRGCVSLETIFVSDGFVVAEGTASADMFDGCPAAVVVGREVAVGRYCKLNLEKALGVKISEDVDYANGDKVAVKVEGLAKGLKLVATQQKETTGRKAVTNVIYTIEGVPAEAIDLDARPMYARVTVTYKDKPKGDKGRTESLQPIPLSIATPEPSGLTAGALDEVYEPADIAALWPAVGKAKVSPKEWSFRGWPAGVKYNSKATAASWSYKDSGGKSVKTTAAPYTVYGQPTKAGEYPITATWKHKLADGKTTVSETFSAVLTVWGDDGKSEFRYEDQAYGAAVDETIADAKSVSGLPTGLKFKDGKVTGTPTKPGVFAVTATKEDGSKEAFLWKVKPGENDGFLGTMDWAVTNSALKVMAGVIQTNWTCSLPATAKATASGLPAGLKLALNREKAAWILSGTPAKAGNFVVTFKTVRNGVTVTERLSIVVEPNEWTGKWYGVQVGPDADASLLGEATVSANGTVKLVFTEATTNYAANGAVRSAVRKTTVTVRNLDPNGTTATLVLPGNKKDGPSEDRVCALDFENGTLSIDGAAAQMAFGRVDGEWSEEASLADVTTVVLEEVDEGMTNAYAYLTATYDANKGSFALAGKLWDGAAVKGTCWALGVGNVLTLTPVLVTDKAKNAVTFTLSFDGCGIPSVAVRENGETLVLCGGNAPWSAGFDAAELKSRKFNQLSEATGLVVLTGEGELSLALSGGDLGASVSAQGLVKFTVADDKGRKWACELVPVANGGGRPQFRGFATGTKKGEETQFCPVWTE